MVLVPCDGADQREVATLLLAMADEKGLDRTAIRLVYNGFEVPDGLLDEVDKAVIAPEPEALPTPEAPVRRGRPGPKAAVKE